ncbi:hypothetical protein D3C77_646680 [compost metagenome]
MDFTGMALQQHFGNSGRPAKISIDNKNVRLRSGNAWLRIGQHIVKAQFTDQMRDMLAGLIPIVQPGIIKAE